MTFVDVADLGFDGTDNATGIFAALHLDDAGYGFGHTILDHGALTRFRAHTNRGHIAYEDRGTVHFFQHDVADIVQVADQANPPNQIAFFIDRHLAATGIGIVAGQGVVDILHREVVMMQALRVCRDLVFAGIAAHGVDFCHARHAAQHRSHNPVLHDAALGQLFHREGTFAICRMLDGVLVDLTQPGGYWPQDRRHARRHAPHDFDEPFQHHLPGEVDVGAVRKYQGNDGNAITVERPHVGQTG